MACESFPNGCPLFTLAEVQLGDGFLCFLQAYRISIAIIVFDNLFLMAAAFGWHLAILVKAGCVFRALPRLSAFEMRIYSCVDGYSVRGLGIDVNFRFNE